MGAVAAQRKQLVAPPARLVLERPAGGRPLRRDAAVNRQHILEAAGRLMAERGLGTPLEDIAAAAGVGIGTLYRRFPSRTDLIEALFQDRLAAYVADLEAGVAMPDGWEALVWFLQRSTARQIADRALHELIEHDCGPETIRELRERVLPLAQTLVDHARATGQLRADFTLSDLALVQQMLADIGAATCALSATAWQRYLTIVLDGLLTRRTEPTPATEPALTLEQLKQLRDTKATVPAARQRVPSTSTSPDCPC